MIKHVKNVRFAIAKLAFWHEALLCGIGHQNGWKKSRPFWALTKLWFTWYGLGGYSCKSLINTAQIRCDGMQHMLKHLILPCVFTSKIQVALFYMVFALHLNVAWKWGTLTVSMFFVFLSFVHVFSIYVPNRNSCVVNFPWYFPYGFKILFLFRHLCSWRGLFVVI